MKITVEFESIEEFEAFRTSGKTTRRGKKGEVEATDDTPEPGQIGSTAGGSAPAPMQPPAGNPATGFPGAAGFAPPAAGVAPAGGGFPAAGAPAVDPAVSALVQRIVTRVEAAVASGATKPDDMLTWFRGQCGAEAASATWEQVKLNFLPKMSPPQLEGVAKMVNA